LNILKYIIGFHKEQVNANLLNGKGEIHNVSINCAFLNEEISKFTRYIQLEDIHVSKLSFCVTSWTNLKKSPICIDIEQVTVKIVEPLSYPPGKIRRRIRQITKSELEQQIKEGLIPRRSSPYNLFDRILDNLTVDIESVKIHFQTLGKFKTKRKGPWNPPELIVDVRHIRIVTVNEYGQEAPPEEVWRHNHNRKTGSIFVFKKIEMDFDILLHQRDNKIQTDPIKIISGGGISSKMEVQIALERRIKDGECLAVQVDSFLPEIGIEIKSNVAPIVVHTIAGLQYLVAKDRAFVDPLKSDNTLVDTFEDPSHLEIVSSSDAEEYHDTTTIIEAKTSSDDEIKDSLVDNTLEEEIDDVSSVSSVENDDTRKNAEADFEANISVCQESNDDLDLRPVIVLRNGFVIHDKISMSATVGQVTILGLYQLVDGHFQVLMKQLTSEFIWPKTTQVCI
jgi:N-terminal region of Chorein or VPS13